MGTGILFSMLQRKIYYLVENEDILGFFGVIIRKKKTKLNNTSERDICLIQVHVHPDWMILPKIIKYVRRNTSINDTIFLSGVNGDVKGERYLINYGFRKNACGFMYEVEHD